MRPPTSIRQIVNASSARSGLLTILTLQLCCIFYVTAADAQENPPATAKNAQEIVSYDAAFFERYQPNSALEMISRIPGFQIDDGDDKRGFGAASGNILINDRYPSAKQDKATSIVDRIPASQVARIDLIRGQVRGIDLRGQSVVASIILHDDIPATTRWDVATRKNFEHSPLTVRSSVSLSDTWKQLEYNVGIVYRHFHSGEAGIEDVSDANGVLAEARLEESSLSGDLVTGNLNVLTWIGKTLLSVNTQLFREERKEFIDSVTAPRAPAAQSDDFFIDDSLKKQLEIGADAERSLSPDLLAKAIVLYTRTEEDSSSAQNRLDSGGTELLNRIAVSDIVESEAIGRLEFDWVGWENHAVKLDFEGARNVIDSTLVQMVDTGTGPVVVPVPGGNTRVEENRVDFLINDTWYRDEFEFDYGIGAETSTIEQTGDAIVKRSFFFLKPRFSIAYSPTQQRQSRISIAREVSQLDFSDFISSTVFEDDDLALGNPNLKPESTWVAAFSEERRFGELSVLKVTFFHHWIDDVEDLLPLSADFEAPGNIGTGRRWGVEFEATVPLEKLGIAGGRIDFEARLQDSTVTDPVNGADRELSGEANIRKPLSFRNENSYAYGIDFRQDFKDAQFAWGGDVRRRGNRIAYRVNELVEFEDGLEFNMFAETTRWLGMKVRLHVLNILDFNQFRFRTIFAGERGLTPVDSIELRDRTDGRRVILTLSGSF